MEIDQVNSSGGEVEQMKSTSQNVENNDDEIFEETQIDAESTCALLANDSQPFANSEITSSENFKIIIHHTPRYQGVKQIRNFIKRESGVSARKVMSKWDHAYVTFDNEYDRRKAMSVLHNFKWKGQILKVKAADAVDDPILQNMRRADKEHSSRDTADGADALLASAAPLADKPYEEQLSIKQSSSEKLLIDISRQIKRECYKQFEEGKEHFGVLESIRPSPVVNGYRNKCEFTIGYDSDGLAEAGFRMSRYKDGGHLVAPVDQCPHVPGMMKNFLTHFRQFLRQSDRPAYDVVKKCGFWRMLTTKFFKFDFMLIVTVNPQNVAADEMEIIKKNLTQTFLGANFDFSYRITSMYISYVTNQSDPINYELLGGAPYVYETLLGCRFRISPASFFQTNTAACEIIYAAIPTVTPLNERTLLLDVCCGAGTIGITLADKVQDVMGFEICAEAVEDARINALCNERANCAFTCGKAEDIFEQIRRTKSLDFDRYERVTVVLDPPRKGVADKVVSCIRECRNIRHVIYVSCDPKAATKNFVDLCRFTSNRYPGIGFDLTRVVPVDMFPHTNLCEWILLFQREQ